MSKWRRAGKWTLVVGGLLAVWVLTAVLGALVAQSRVPVELPTVFDVSDYSTKYGLVTASGTWTIEGDKQAFPLQTTKIECWSEWKHCISATAEVAFGDLLNVNIDFYPITEWTRTSVVFVDESPGCARYVYTINMATKSVTGVRHRKTAPKSPLLDCDKLTEELRMTMRKGFDVSYPMSQEAMPWYGRVAFAPFLLFR